jgi:hypothetical protein
MRRPSLTIVLTAVLSAPAGDAARAQSLQSFDTIPRELVALLLRGPGAYPGDNFDIKIGAPPNFPRELLPGGVTAAASTISERGMTVVAEAPQLTSRDLAQHDRDLAAAGWTNSMSMSARGLVSSSTSPMSSTCKGDQYATISYSQRPAGGLYLRVSLTTDPRRGSCVPAGQRPPANFADVDLPPLASPEGVRMMISGSGGGTDNYEQRIRLETAAEPAALVRHYGDQLEKAGWKRESAAGAAGVAFARFTFVTAAKDTVVGLVTVTTLPGGMQTDVSLRLLRIDPGRRFPGRGAGAGPR